GRRREQFKDTQRLRAVGERMMPRIPAKYHGLAGVDAMDLAGLGVGDHHLAAQHMEQFVRAEDSPVCLGMPESAAERDAENQLMDLIAGNVDPIRDLTGFGVAPKMPSGRYVRDVRRSVKRGPRRGCVPLSTHAYRSGLWIR